MSIETELVSRLEDDSGVGTNAGDRIYAVNLPQNPTYPAIVYRRISGNRVHNLSGAAGWDVARIQVDSWARTYGAAVSTAASVRASLNGFSGTLATLKAVIKLENEIDDYDEEAKVFRVIQDYMITHTE